MHSPWISPCTYNHRIIIPFADDMIILHKWSTFNGAYKWVTKWGGAFLFVIHEGLSNFLDVANTPKKQHKWTHWAHERTHLFHQNSVWLVWAWSQYDSLRLLTDYLSLWCHPKVKTYDGAGYNVLWYCYIHKSFLLLEIRVDMAASSTLILMS